MSATEELPHLYTEAGAASYLRKSVITLRRGRRLKRLGCVKIGLDVFSRKMYRPVVPLTYALAAHLKAAGEPAYYAGWNDRKTKSIETTARAKLPAWFAPKVLRHTVASELRKRGVPGWEVSGLVGHKRGEAAATTGGYAKFDPAYMDKARKALDAWVADLARDVPQLRGVSPGSAVPKKKNGAAPKGYAVQPLKVVGGTGFEPVTPTMSR